MLGLDLFRLGVLQVLHFCYKQLQTDADNFKHIQTSMNLHWWVCRTCMCFNVGIEQRRDLNNVGIHGNP
jgi:hypothetical protein